jgi:hypothetical protein
MYFTVVPRKKRKKRKVGFLDAIRMTDRLGSLLDGSVRRDTIGSFGTSVMRTDGLDALPKARIDWDVIFRTPETEITRIRAERAQEIANNHRQNTL